MRRKPPHVRGLRKIVREMRRVAALKGPDSQALAPGVRAVPWTDFAAAEIP